MSDEEVEAVKRALRRLVTGDRVSVTVEIESTIDEAEAAISTVSEAAAFADRDGFANVERAVAAAERDENTALAKRGQEVLQKIGAYRTAAAEYFHPGHEGLMGGEPVLSDTST